MPKADCNPKIKIVEVYAKDFLTKYGDLIKCRVLQNESTGLFFTYMNVDEVETIAPAGFDQSTAEKDITRYGNALCKLAKPRTERGKGLTREEPETFAHTN